MKYIAKDLDEVAEMLDIRAESEGRLATAFEKHNKGAAASHKARQGAFADAASFVREVELRP